MMEKDTKKTTGKKCQFIYFSGILPELPKGLVNINYGFHGCVHLGTELDPYMTGKNQSIKKFNNSIK